MEAQDQGMSVDQYKVQHLRRRIAHLVVQHEDDLTEAAIREQIVTQERDEARRLAQEAAQEVLARDEEIARLKEKYESEIESLEEDDEQN